MLLVTPFPLQLLPALHRMFGKAGAKGGGSRKDGQAWICVPWKPSSPTCQGCASQMSDPPYTQTTPLLDCLCSICFPSIREPADKGFSFSALLSFWSDKVVIFSTVSSQLLQLCRHSITLQVHSPPASSEEAILQRINSLKTALRREPTGEISGETPKKGRPKLSSFWSYADSKVPEEVVTPVNGASFSHQDSNKFCSSNTEYIKIGTFEN